MTVTAPLARATFAPLVGATFRLDGPGEFPAELLELVEGGAPAGWEHFSLLFAAPADAPATQGIYHVEHDTIGALDLFLVPVGHEGGHLLYEAVISRPADGSDAP